MSDSKFLYNKAHNST